MDNKNFNSLFGNSGSATPYGTTHAPTRATTNAFLQRVFVIMAAGLGITGLTAFGVSLNTELMMTLFGTPLRYVLMFAPLAFILAINFGIARMSYFTATMVFSAFAITMGVSLSSIFLVYQMGSIASTFFITAGMFSAMAFYGMTTKTDLTKMGSYLMMAVFGLIIASVVNIFLQSGPFSWLISFAGVIIFTGLTAYDTQKIVELSREMGHDSEESRKASLLGALTLYLDFINLFLFLLRLIGVRRDD
jgi:uncharacterized protein